MKFYKMEDIVPRDDDQVFKSSPTGKCIFFVIFLAMGLACLYGAIHGGVNHDRWHLPVPLLYIMAVIFGLVAWLGFTLFRASLKPTNWVMRCNRDGVILKYRSYLNWRFPPGDVQAVGFDYAEIAWARTVKEKRITPSTDSHGGSQSQYLTYLDFCLANTDTSALEANLQREQQLSPDGMATWRDYPVNVLPGGMIEVRWTGIKPSVAHAIKYLNQHVKIGETEKRRTDLTHHQGGNILQERDKIVALIKSGDDMGAVHLTQQVYGYSLSEAHSYVDKLRANP